MDELVLEVIESYNQYLSKVANGSVQIADAIRKQEISNALKMILDFSEGMGWLVDASNLLTEKKVQVALHAEQIHEFLGEINTGLENQDYILVADMFEYEIAPFFEQVQPIKNIGN